MIDNLERLRRRTQEEDIELLEEMLESAKYVILSARFPYQDDDDYPEMPKRYSDLQVRIAEDMYNRIGASGQLSHSENGVSRSWGSEWVSSELLREITPICRVVQ